jgi:hypothetical protein
MNVGLNRVFRRPRLNLREGPFGVSIPLTGRGRAWVGANLRGPGGTRIRISKPVSRSHGR